MIVCCSLNGYFLRIDAFFFLLSYYYFANKQPNPLLIAFTSKFC